MAGTWQRLDDRSLSFKPEGDWPVGQQYRLGFSKTDLLAAGVLLQEYDTSLPLSPLPPPLPRPRSIKTPSTPLLKRWWPPSTFPTLGRAEQLNGAIALQLGEGLTYRDPAHKDFSIQVDKDGLHAHIRCCR